jgi:hypothetical protein
VNQVIKIIRSIKKPISKKKKKNPMLGMGKKGSYWGISFTGGELHMSNCFVICCILGFRYRKQEVVFNSDFWQFWPLACFFMFSYFNLLACITSK